VNYYAVAEIDVTDPAWIREYVAGEDSNGVRIDSRDPR
jgi:uncharacterized protein (DUF1330 family)